MASFGQIVGRQAASDHTAAFRESAGAEGMNRDRPAGRELAAEPTAVLSHLAGRQCAACTNLRRDVFCRTFSLLR